MRKIAAIIAFTVLLTPAFCQETTTAPKKTSRPDIPGTFTIELGVNSAPKAPNRFDLGFWGSRTVNFYYQYDIRILKSKFSFVPGIGLSMERFKLKNGYSLGYSADSLALLTPSQAGYSNLKKSHLVTNYIEVPLEICFRTNPDDPARSFKASVGGRIGYLYDSFNKVKYKEGSEVKKIKDKQDFQLNKIRYGIYGKVGVGNFSVFTYYNLSPLFESGKGPVEKKTRTEFSTLTIGISLASF